MFRQTIIFALRSFRKSKLIHGLNLMGLTLGLSVYFLVMLYLYQERSYEKDFTERDDTFQVSYTLLGSKFATGPPNLAQVVREIPEVEKFTSFRSRGKSTVRVDEQTFAGDAYYVDSSFLEVFDFKMLIGDTKGVLSAPNSVVLSEDYANELFKSTDVYGKAIYLTRVERDSVYEIPLVVTGVLKRATFKTQLDFDLLISEKRTVDSSLPLDGWQKASVYNYLVAAPNTSKQKLDEKLFDLSHKYIQIKTYGGQKMSKEDWKNAPAYCGFYTESLGDLRIGSETTYNLMPSLDESQLKTMTIVSLAALIISILNFISLSTARASIRMKEVGVKRILGSSKQQLIFQFMIESFAVVFLSSIMALAIVEGLIKLKTGLVGIQVDYSVLQSSEWVLGLVIFIIVLTLISGLYPAMYLASANLATVLRKGSAKNSFSLLNASALRKGAAVLQFTCAAALMIGVITMYLQVNHLRTKDMGYDSSSVLVLKTGSLKDSKNTFRDALDKFPSIDAASHVNRMPFQESFERPLEVKLTDSTKMSFVNFNVDDSFFETMSMDFVQGYGFDAYEGSLITESNGEDNPQQIRYPVIINKAAADAMGMNTDSEINFVDARFNIIGVVDDFIFSDLRQAVQPVLITRKTSAGRSVYHYPLVVKVNDKESSLTSIQETWSSFSEDELRYEYMESSFDNLLTIEEQGLRAVLVFSLLSVVVSCVGLFGLAVFTLDQRIQEFGIRKVLGASVADIMRLFGTGFVGLIIMAYCLAIPISFLLLQEWLSTYADRITLSAQVFLLAAVVMVLVVGLTLLAQSFKAGRLNPVDTLRSE